ncbi:hypothetical protein M0638_13555 [Roseomonas sp. NAR14]|uniref:Uncharacterized protein n=1 Tax=Roseomonas acroporae TaxID=2937791 RepID=A0A9X1Y979_9PROT|nr:hypothetical protein [Roseomonas acroporae]MCK8785410.1 hypothetical protein [Roseomonas acroporae]
MSESGTDPLSLAAARLEAAVERLARLASDRLRELSEARQDAAMGAVSSHAAITALAERLDATIGKLRNVLGEAALTDEAAMARPAGGAPDDMASPVAPPVAEPEGPGPGEAPHAALPRFDTGDEPSPSDPPPAGPGPDDAPQQPGSWPVQGYPPYRSSDGGPDGGASGGGAPDTAYGGSGFHDERR